MIAAVDIGGTKTLVAVFDDHGVIKEQQKFHTNPNYELFKQELADAVAKLSTHDFSAGYIGMRGNIDREQGLSLKDDVLAWGEVSIKKDCENIFGCPFGLENDSKLAGVAEARVASKEYSKILYLTISSGIGSSLIINGELDHDTIDSEIGKGTYEHEGKLQQWEDFASGKAIVARYHKRAGEIDDPAAWKEISRNIAIGLINAIVAYRPDLVIIGGGVGAHFAKFEKSLNEALSEFKPDEIDLPPVKQALHPEEAVIYGCYEYAKQQL